MKNTELADRIKELEESVSQSHESARELETKFKDQAE
jgi:hypothetical protein